MAKLCLPLGFVLAVMISADADNCVGGECKAFGASSMRQSEANTALSMLQSTAKRHYAKYVRSSANSSLVAKAPTTTTTPAPTPGDGEDYERLETQSLLLRREANTPWMNTHCFTVNGICFLWASPCSGGCSQVTVPQTIVGCPGGIEYATPNEWSAAKPTLEADRYAFHLKCAAGDLDPSHNHCDGVNQFVRVPDGSYNELVLVCRSAQTPQPTPSPTLDPTPSPTTTTTTTTTISLEGLDEDEQKIEVNDEQVDQHECRSWCYSKKHNHKPWTGTRGKCNWYACSTCPKCMAA